MAQTFTFEALPGRELRLWLFKDVKNSRCTPLLSFVQTHCSYIKEWTNTSRRYLILCTTRISTLPVLRRQDVNQTDAAGSFKKKFKAGAWTRSALSSMQHWFAPHNSHSYVHSPTCCSCDNAHKVQQNRQHWKSMSQRLHSLKKKPYIPPTVLTQLTALRMLFRSEIHAYPGTPWGTISVE